jgi:uncharacterized repeat protein (TIGR02543 family)/uncharacterized repeat protein (TIGR01451 family)
MSKPGHIFGGWWHSDKNKILQKGDTFGIDGETTLTAVWLPENMIIEKTPNVTTIKAGNDVIYTITVKAANAATNVVITESLSGGEWGAATINGDPANGYSTTDQTVTITALAAYDIFVITYTMKNVTPGTLKNSVTVDSEEGDEAEAESDDVTVLPQNLSIDKTPNTTTVSAGDDVIYTITVTATGAATNVIITESLTGGEWGEATLNGTPLNSDPTAPDPVTTYTTNGHTVTINKLAEDDIFMITYTITTSTPGILKNSVTVRSEEGDEDNCDSEDVTVEPAKQPERYTVTYNANGATGGTTPVDPNEYINGDTVTVLGNTGNLIRSGYTFNGWATTPTGAAVYNQDQTFTIENDTLLYAAWKRDSTGGPTGPGGPDITDPEVPLEFLESTEHRIYIKGYPDSTVRPDRNITRAEVATIFYRLLKDTYKDGNAISTFSDVPFDAWFSEAISTLADLGIIIGYGDGTFRPNNPITRAEFATLAARFDKLAAVEGIAFSDVPSAHWAAEYIHSAYAKGWVNGYEDGTFRPAQQITRAEVTKIVNTMLERLPEELPEMLINPYIDIIETHWAFIHMMEASIEHTYARDDDDIEFWTTHRCPVTGELLIHVDDHDLLPPWLQ